MNNIEFFNRLLIDNYHKVSEWFNSQYTIYNKILYASVDIRDSGEKIVPVDTNLFPAGFNNLKKNEIEIASAQLKQYLQENFKKVKKILLVPESHTRNINYFKNLYILSQIIEKSGFEVRIGHLDITEIFDLENEFGIKLKIYPVTKENGYLISASFTADLVIINNDLSSGIPEKLLDIEQPILPHLTAGWFARKKSDHFASYKKVLTKFCNEFNLDSFYFSADYLSCGNVDFKEKKGLDCVVNSADKLLFLVRKKYEEKSISQKPYVFVKAERGTYGMGIMSIANGQEIYNMNKDIRKKMNIIKGGIQNTEVVIQEGIQTINKFKGFPAEMMLYTVNSEPISYICRYNELKTNKDNLNSKGLNFINASHLMTVNPERYKIYNIIAKLAVLSAAQETGSFH